MGLAPNGAEFKSCICHLRANYLTFLISSLKKKQKTEFQRIVIGSKQNTWSDIFLKKKKHLNWLRWRQKYRKLPFGRGHIYLGKQLVCNFDILIRITEITILVLFSYPSPTPLKLDILVPVRNCFIEAGPCPWSIRNLSFKLYYLILYTHTHIFSYSVLPLQKMLKMLCDQECGGIAGSMQCDSKEHRHYPFDNFA